MRNKPAPSRRANSRCMATSARHIAITFEGSTRSNAISQTPIDPPEQYPGFKEMRRARRETTISGKTLEADVFPRSPSDGQISARPCRWLLMRVRRATSARLNCASGRRSGDETCSDGRLRSSAQCSTISLECASSARIPMSHSTEIPVTK